MNWKNSVLEITILVIILRSGVNGSTCASSSSCRCHYSEGDIYADCSKLGLSRSPLFWSNVTKINLSHNNLNRLPNRSKLPDDLDYLDLSNNVINEFTNEAFQGLQRLTDLKLQSNRFRITSNLSKNIFADLISIRNLDLSDNPELTFPVMPYLSSLQNSSIEVLRLNKIHCTFGLGLEVKIEDLRFLRYTNLKEIDISSNRIELFENRALSFLPDSLKRVSIADNNLSFGYYVFDISSMKGLEWLEASSQGITHSPYDFIYNRPCHDTLVKKKTSLSISKNDLSHNTFDLGNKSRLKRNIKQEMKVKMVDIFQRKKLSIVFNISLPENLKSIFFNQSGLHYRIKSFNFSRNKVENLYLQDNILYSWMGPISGVNNLKIVNLSNNFCAKVYESFFQNGDSLQKLYLSNNLLRFSLSSDTDGKIFRNLKSLSVLDLKANKISHLPSAVFKSLESLKYLDLSSNLLTGIDFDIRYLRSLRVLDLSLNQIQYLSDSDMKAIDQHRMGKSLTINLSGNPILCACKSLNFLTWIVHSQTSGEIIFESYEQYFCEKESHDGQVMNFTNSKVIGELRKKCNTYTTLIFMMSTLIFLFVISLAIGIFYRYRWKLRYFFYMTKSRYHGYKAVRSDSQSNFKYDAFVSYADEDLPFVQKMIWEFERNNEIRLCIHHRDFVPGYDIAENIITAVNKSRKTIIILSPNFINSSWCMYEMHIAKMEEIYSRDDQSVLVIIFYKPIPAGKIPLQIMNVIKEKSYIEFPDDEYCDAMFWRKVIETAKNV
ncbi:toll-like receptor 4 [Saccostrea cucullata]|uniref:toll-like receptor 4 n=1 Tax=Saccostrea cuccullata TaxID=36930 RepID=UPI002ED42122